MKPEVSIVVIAYNEEKKLPFCLDSLVNLDYPKGKLEIIVVDNNSTGRTKQVIKNYPVKYVFEETKGRGRARNKGVEVSRGELIAFIDADCVADKAWLKNIVKGFTNENIAGCGGETLPYRVQTLAERYSDFKDKSDGKICGIRVSRRSNVFPDIACCNAVYRRDILDKVGGFDSSFVYGEDTELYWRVVLQGYHSNCVEEAIVYHWSPSLVGILRRHFVWGLVTSRLVEKYRKVVSGGVGSCYGQVSRVLRMLKKETPELISRNVPMSFVCLEVATNLMHIPGLAYGWLRLKLGKEDCPSLDPIDKVVWWSTSEGVTIAKLNKGCYRRYSLSSLGARVWQMLREGKSVEQVIQTVSAECQFDLEKAKVGVVSLIAKLEAEGLVGSI